MIFGIRGRQQPSPPLERWLLPEGSMQTPQDFPLGKSRGNPKGCVGFREKPGTPRWHDNGAKRLVLWNKVYHATLCREGGAENGTYA